MKEIFDSIDEDELIELLCSIVEQDTTNPPGNEYKVAEIVRIFFEQNEIPYLIHEKEKGRTNIIGRIGEGSPKILIACHSDVVPAGDGWKTNPFEPVIEDGKVYGRGTCDNKDSIASMLIAGKLIKENIKKINGQIILAVLADEEHGSDYGLNYIRDEGFLEFDYAIVPDIGGNMNKTDVAEKGALHFKIISYGKQAHGSRPDKGINAIEYMIELLNEIKNYEFDYEPHELLKVPTINIGMIKGGEAVNIVPAKCTVGIDIRYLPSQTKEEIIKDFEDMMKKVEEENPYAKFGIEIITHHAPAELLENIGLARVFRESTKQVMGFKPDIIGMGGHTFAGLLMERGLNAIGVGMGDDIAHQANEYIQIDEMVNFTKILILSIIKLLGGEKK